LYSKGRFGRVAYSDKSVRFGTAYSAVGTHAGRGGKARKKSKKSKRSRRGRKPKSAPPVVTPAAYVTEESFVTDPDKNCSIQVRVSPKAVQGSIVGWMDDGFLKVRILAAPEGGRANIELMRLLAQELKVPIGNLSIIRGSASTNKLIKVVGLEEDEVRRRLSK
jgi:uncharacterized protein (TIGR00251 family)